VLAIAGKQGPHQVDDLSREQRLQRGIVRGDGLALMHGDEDGVPKLPS
jgi:hypothetical protein